MYLPHTSVFHNRAYSSRRFADAELQKAKSSISSLGKIVAFSVLLIIMTVAGLSGLGIITMQNQNTTDNTIDATKQDVQANLGDLTALKNRIEQLEKSNQQMSSSATNITDALARDINSLKDEFNKLSNNLSESRGYLDTINNVVQINQNTSTMDINSLKDEVYKLSNNQTESRGHLTTMDNLVQVVQKSQNASEIASRDYQIDNNGQLQTLNKTLLEVQEKLNAPVRQVAFHVNNPTGNVIHGRPIFDTTELNEGGAYNTTTGLFTCQVNGVYLFTLTIVGAPIRTSKVYCILYWNDNAIATAWNQEGSYESASLATVLHLSVDDVVRLFCAAWKQAYKSYETSYSGVLIRPD